MADSRTGKYKISLEYLTEKKSKEELPKKGGGMSEEHRGESERAPSGQSWNNLSKE